MDRITSYQRDLELLLVKYLVATRDGTRNVYIVGCLLCLSERVVTWMSMIKASDVMVRCIVFLSLMSAAQISFVCRIR